MYVCVVRVDDDVLPYACQCATAYICIQLVVCSSQCPTTSATKVVVCVILSVG